MILSMTGFGEASVTARQVGYHLEIRALNNRYFKLNCKLPDRAVFLEAQIESRLRRVLARGSVQLNLSVRNMSADAAYEVNRVALDSYLKHLEALLADRGGTLPLAIDLATAVALPGVAQPREESEDAQAEVRQTFEPLLAEALDKLTAMRRAEGQSIVRDLQAQLDQMAEQLKVIAERAPFVMAEYQQRLAERVNRLLADQKIQLEAESLAKEVALYADRSDINEELSRLASHIEQFRAALADGGDAGADEPAPQVGRKLDFLAQEFLREANTIGSKSNDAAITRACVQIKSTIDRIKEQVQNVV